MSRFLIDMPCASFKARFVPGFLRLSVFGFAFVLLLLVPVSSAWAQSSYELGNRMKRLENEIQTLSRAVYRGETPPAGSASGGTRSGGADVEIRLQQVERELRELRGLIERESHDVRQIRAEMERVTSDLELRLNELEGGGRSAVGRGSGSSVPYTAGGAGNSQLKPPAGQDDSYQWSSKKPTSGGSLGSYGGGASDQAAASYEAAFSLVKNSQYSAAEKGFLSFLERYPNHVLASNAQYWLGETYYVRGKFEKAARVFAEGYQTNPKGTKAADNLLKLGMSLAGLGKTEDACVALQQLDKEKTGASSPVMRRAEQEKSRLSCP